MHEIKLTEDMIAILNHEVASPEVGNVKTIYLEVGKMRYIVPDIIMSCFEHIPKNEKLKNAKIEIKELPVKLKCANCKGEGEVKDGIYSCRACGSDETSIVSGNEFNIARIEW